MAKSKDLSLTINDEDYKHYVTDEEVNTLVAENKRRMENIFGPYDPFIGLNCYDFENRVCFECEDFIKPVTYIPEECMNNVMFRQVYECKSIAKYLEDKAHLDVTQANIEYVQRLLCQMRAKEDCEFGIYISDNIQDKMSGKMIPFRLNYPQRVLNKTCEDIRHSPDDIGEYVIVGKARQWGGSTYSQHRIKWVQDFRHDGWNAAVVAQTKNTAKKIKAMYKKSVQYQPGWTVGSPGERLQLTPYENSPDDFIVSDSKGPIRRSILTVSAYEIINNIRGENYHCAHLSEVAYWKKTQEHDPNDVISSLLGGIMNQKDNIVIVESTGRGASGFFYDTWQEARDPDTPSVWTPLFIPFFIIENDHKPLITPPHPVESIYDKYYCSLDENIQAEREFARWLLENRDASVNPKGYRESGKFFWRLWRLGANFEAINWYRHKRNGFSDHASCATEAPVDEVEMFKTSGNLVFNPYSIADLRDSCRKTPSYYGEIQLIGERGKKMIRDSKVRLREDGVGELKIWALPNNQIMRAKNRYIVSVDIGGNSSRADFSVMTVIDRIGMIPGVGGKPEVVARYRSHCRHDKLAWKAAVLAKYYDNALLVIESNTADRERNSNTEGDHFGSIIEQIADYYDNLYTRAAPSEAVSEKPLRKYGFQTNKLNKGWLIDNLVAYVEDKLFVDPDDELYHELSIYERRDDGSLGNIPGTNNHDDVLMSLAIGLWVSANDVDMPDWIKVNSSKRKSTNKISLNEAAF